VVTLQLTGGYPAAHEWLPCSLEVVALQRYRVALSTAKVRCNSRVVTLQLTGGYPAAHRRLPCTRSILCPTSYIEVYATTYSTATEFTLQPLVGTGYLPCSCKIHLRQSHKQLTLQPQPTYPAATASRLDPRISFLSYNPPIV
jgi:hypothetical protein